MGVITNNPSSARDVAEDLRDASADLNPNPVADIPVSPTGELNGLNEQSREEHFVVFRPQDGDDPFVIGGGADAEPDQIPGLEAENDPTGVRAALREAIERLPESERSAVEGQLRTYERQMQGIENKIAQLHKDIIPPGNAGGIKKFEASAASFAGITADGVEGTFRLGDGPGGALGLYQRREILNLHREDKLDDLLDAIKEDAEIADTVARALHIDAKDLRGLEDEQKQAVIVAYLETAKEYLEKAEAGGERSMISVTDRAYSEVLTATIEAMNAELEKRKVETRFVAPTEVGEAPTVR